MHSSVLEFYTIGIGPSSSHTVGPMRAAAAFVDQLAKGVKPQRIRCDFYGSLAATGKGHQSDRAVILGFTGNTPENIDPEKIIPLVEHAQKFKEIILPTHGAIPFHVQEDLTFHRTTPLPRHPNGMHFIAMDAHENIIHEEIYYSLGGGFICTESEFGHPPPNSIATIPYPYDRADDLLKLCAEHSLTIAELTLANENEFRPAADTKQQLERIWQAMQDCIARGCSAEGVLPGGLKVLRRAPDLHKKLALLTDENAPDHLTVLDQINLCAMAVNEENAAGCRVVTAPTNGAAGIIPAVLFYATHFRSSPHANPVQTFLLTAGALATLYKKNASISGADVGCQGEVGVACSMAAGGLAAFLGGSPKQVENAAEIGMEHNLGLTCDPIGGLVQIPCIERNAMGAVKAINAARLALNSDGQHHVSLDKVIATMLQTGHDMMDKYKETSRGGLALNHPLC